MVLLCSIHIQAMLAGLVVGLVTQTAGIKVHREVAAKDEETVCVSVAVYEDASYVDGLLKNFLYFAEPSSRLVMHLDSRSDYTEQQIEAWKSDRVAITKERIPVDAFKGSILWGMMLNTRTMQEEWGNKAKGGACAYFVYQASNMMWVRKGFESEVRSRRYGSLHQMPEADHGSCSSGQSITEELIKPRQIYGWGQPEGSFYPMSMMRDFLELMSNSPKVLKEGESIMNAKCFLEAFSLQTYALNYEPIFQDDKTALTYRLSRSLSWNHITYGNKDEDSVPRDEVIAISKGEPGWEPYYAVKRVNRNVNHPITQFILSLAQ